MSANAELSSLCTGVEELAGRVTRLAEGLGAEERELVGPDLFEVERSLRSAQRRLRKLLDRRLA